MCAGVPLFMNSGVQEFKRAGVTGCMDAGVPQSMCAGVPLFMNTGVQEFERAGVTVCRGAWTPECRNPCVRVCRCS
jgi:hypothetical protein